MPNEYMRTRVETFESDGLGLACSLHLDFVEHEQDKWTSIKFICVRIEDGLDAESINQFLENILTTQTSKEQSTVLCGKFNFAIDETHELISYIQKLFKLGFHMAPKSLYRTAPTTDSSFLFVNQPARMEIERQFMYFPEHSGFLLLRAKRRVFVRFEEFEVNCAETRYPVIHPKRMLTAVTEFVMEK